MRFQAVLFLFVVSTSALSDREEREQKFCTTASCVHSSSTVLRNLDLEADPCDDFYDFVCGKFADELGVPDEKATINTLNRITERVHEFVFGLAYIDPNEDGNYRELALKLPKHHRISKMFYNSCLNMEKIRALGATPLVKFLERIGGWPMLEGKDWEQDKFNWSKAIQSLRNINKPGHQLKRPNDPDTNEVDNLATDSTRTVREAYKILLFEIIDLITQKNDSIKADKEIDELIDFEFRLDDFSRKYKAYKTKLKGSKKNAVTAFYKDIIWFNQFQPSAFRNISLYDGVVGEEIVGSFLSFLQNTPPRTIANYLATRIVIRGIYFLGDEFRNAILKYDKATNGNEDYEQRWKFCAVVLSQIAPVSIGSLYIERYFSPEDRRVAKDIMDHIVEAYVINVNHSTWLNSTERKAVIDVINKMQKFIGYHIKLESDAANFYENLTEFGPDDFFNQVMALSLFNAERTINQKNGIDWSKYSQPQTVNAFFNAKDDSIQFPAGIIQDPNFDPKRPGAMNFGALGGIISHELSHSYDTYASLVNRTKDILEAKKKCIVDQYTSYRVAEVEEYLNQSFHLNGTATIREDFADMGAVKLSFDAFKLWLSRHPEQKVPIGLNDFTFEQIFWISHGQTFCAYERASTTESKVKDGKYSPERFRVLGPLSNSKEFQKSFNCKEGSKMVRADDKKCVMW